MYKQFTKSTSLLVAISSLYAPSAYSFESLLDASVGARAENNSNIFLTDQPHDSVYGIIITPSISGTIKEQHWQADLNAKVKSYNYSESTIDTNDQFFDLTGRYSAERNLVSLNANYNLASNLSSTSTIFGVVGRRINQKRQSITPQYTRLVTERLRLTFSYAYTDVEYLEAENTGFRPYVTETGSGSLDYDLTEKDKLTISLVAVDYESQNKEITYQLFMSRFGINHKFSETFTTDFLIGVSQRNSTNLSTTSIDFDGNIIDVPREVDFNDRGFVLDAGMSKLLEKIKMEVRISRDNTTNSFGGLDQFDRIKLLFDQKLSSLWRYELSARYEDITSIGSSVRATDRNILFFESRAFYSISKNWFATGSYRYVQRKFKAIDSAPSSNRIYIGLTYNFPSLSTF